MPLDRRNFAEVIFGRNIDTVLIGELAKVLPIRFGAGHVPHLQGRPMVREHNPQHFDARPKVGLKTLLDIFVGDLDDFVEVLVVVEVLVEVIVEVSGGGGAVDISGASASTTGTCTEV